MAKAEKKAVVPRLRFPEFADGEWSAATLSELATFVDERVGASECVPYTVTGGVGLVSQVEKLGRTIAGNSLRNYIVLKRDDFAYNKSATKAFPEGYIARYVGDERAAVPNSIFTCFRADDKKIDPAYLDYLFASNLHGKWLRNFITVGARAHGSLNVNDADLMALPVPLPAGDSSLQEQRKIADCLTSLDALIAAQGRKVEALKTYKRGLMQQLFPREGETRPRIRFPEFCDAPEWEVKAVGELGEVVTGSTPETARKDYYGGRYLFVSPADISEARFVESTKTTLTRTGFSRSRSIQARSVLFVCIGSTIGKVCQNTRECATNQQINSVVPFEDVSGDFVYYLLSMAANRISKLAGKQAVPIINKSVFSSVKVVVPKLDEQIRIADGLSTLDESIAAEAQRLDALKAHKKGLMQQLFPSVEGAK